MSAHFGIGFLLTPRPSTPAVHADVVWQGDEAADVVWNRITDEFAPFERIPPEVVLEEDS